MVDILKQRGWYQTAHGWSHPRYEGRGQTGAQVTKYWQFLSAIEEEMRTMLAQIERGNDLANGRRSRPC